MRSSLKWDTRLLVKLILSLLFMLCQSGQAQTIDLSSETWNPDKQYFLKGKWEFYYHIFLSDSSSTPDVKPVLVDFPSTWESYKVEGSRLPAIGWGTYRVKVILPKNTPSDFALVTNRIKMAHQVFVNGHAVGGEGTPTESASTTVESYKYSISPISTTSKSVEIFIHVSNFTIPRGGVYDIPFIGDTEKITANKIRRTILSGFISGALFLIGISYVALWNSRRNDIVHLIFGWFCLSGTLRLLVAGDKVITFFIPNIPADLLLSLDFWTAFNLIPVMHLYVKQLFPNSFPRWSIYPSLISWVVLTLISIFATLYVKALCLPAFEVYATLVFIHICYVGFSSIRSKTPNSKLFTLVFVLVILTALNDIAMERAWINSFFMFHYGILVFTFAQAVVLALRLTNVYRELEFLNLSLEMQVLERTSDLSAAKAISDNLLHETKLLSARLNSVLEEERKSIAMTLHDSLGASLVSVKMRLSSIQKQLEAIVDAPGSIISDLISCINTINDIYAKARHHFANLRPELIDVLGLNSALESLVNEYNNNSLRTKFYFSTDGEVYDLPDQYKIALFRICQEAITNAIKYAEAENIYVLIEATEKAVTLNIHDDGNGFVASGRFGIGIIGMRERCEELGGRFEIESHLGEGTTVTAEIPLKSHMVP